MAAALTYDVPLYSGSGWFAVAARIGTRFFLYVAPASDVADAVESLISESLRAFWTVEFDHVDPYGWDVYVLDRLLPVPTPR